MLEKVKKTETSTDHRQPHNNNPLSADKNKRLPATTATTTAKPKNFTVSSLVMSPPTPSTASSSGSLVPLRRLSAHELADHFDDFDLHGHTAGSLKIKQSQPQSQSQQAPSASAFSSTTPSASNSPPMSAGASANAANGAAAALDDFTLAPGRPAASQARHAPVSKRNSHHHSHPTQQQSSSACNYRKASSSKERYVFSNFRFLVKDCALLPTDTDEPLDWHAIELVLVAETHSTLCPICLELPRLPRFTRCGHIYCWPCLIQYFQTCDSGKEYGTNWRTCPVCAEPVHLKQLRPVHFCPTTEPQEHRVFETILIQRPVSGGTPDTVMPFAPELRAGGTALTDLSPFARLLPVDDKFMLEQVVGPELRLLREDTKALKALKTETLELSFLGSALSQLEERYRQLRIAESAYNPSSSAKPAEDAQTSAAPSTPCYYFHQSRDGLNVFLHPTCMKILRYEFGEYWQIPGRLSAPVLELERIIVSPLNRRRFKYLDHLPSGTQIILVEVDLEGIVSPDTLRHFQRELAARASARAHRRSLADKRHLQSARSILEEWRMMEDEVMIGSGGSWGNNYTGTITAAPEILNLDDLDDLERFPSVSGAMPISQPMANARFAAPSAYSSSFAEAAASPPSFSALAHSLGSAFTFALDEATAPAVGPSRKFDGIAPISVASSPASLSSPTTAPSFASALSSPNSRGHP